MTDTVKPAILVPLGTHFFSPEALQKAAAEAQADHPGKTKVLKGAVDSNGQQVVLALGNKEGTWKFSTAFSHDNASGFGLGAAGSVAWD